MDTQQNDACELRAIFSARVHHSYARARICLARARLERLQGVTDELRKWVWCARVLRMAAASWRQRARSVAPALTGGV